MKTAENDLLSCPFCGGTPELVDLGVGTGAYMVTCRGCGALMTGSAKESNTEPEIHNEIKEVVIKNWNKRTFYPEGEVIHAKALRKRGVGIFYNYINTKWLIEIYPCLFSRDTITKDYLYLDGSHLAIKLPADAELVDLEIKVIEPKT